MGVRDGLHVNVWRWGNGKGRGRAGKERHQQELEMTNIPCPPWGRCLPVQTATRQSKRPALWWTRGVNPSVWSVANVCISQFEVSDNCASLQMSPTNRLDETEHLLKKSYKFHLSQGDALLQKEDDSSVSAQHLKRGRLLWVQRFPNSWGMYSCNGTEREKVRKGLIQKWLKLLGPLPSRLPTLTLFHSSGFTWLMTWKQLISVLNSTCQWAPLCSFLKRKKIKLFN